MDWILMATTLFVNSALGWWKGRPWTWAMHATNSVLWAWYSIVTDQWGFLALSFVTFGVDVVSWARVTVSERTEARDYILGADLYEGQYACCDKCDLNFRVPHVEVAINGIPLARCPRCDYMTEL